MKKGLFTISREAEAEIEIKRSRFIGRSFKCISPAEALAAVKRVRETFRDATHHCWAYRIGTSGEQARYDNCGEPQGTAGPPILDVLKNNGLTDTLIVVTRYYGGTKLGAGGLVRAYGEAAKRVLEESRPSELRLMRDIEARVPYNLLSPLESRAAKDGCEITAREFGESVLVRLRIPAEKEAEFRAFHTDLVGGKFAFTVLGDVNPLRGNPRT